VSTAADRPPWADALEAYRRTHPRERLAVDDAMERRPQDSESVEGLTASDASGTADSEDLHEWYDLLPVWRKATEAAAQRDGQKRGFASSRYWNQESHFLGLLGEYVYGHVSRQEVNLTLDVTGDGGLDFPGIDVKATRYYTKPYLKHPATSNRWPPFFVLVAINVDARLGRYCGHIAGHALQKHGTLRDFGHGPQRTMDEFELIPGLP
jgi:hypothetical protein